MKIAIISKSGRGGGGASRVAEELALWLNQSGHTADHFVAHLHAEQPVFQQSLYGQGRRQELCKNIHRKSYEHGFREIIPAEYFLNLGRRLEQYDIVHFHDLYTAISPLTMALTSWRKPTVFTAHDCSIFTGGCLYPMECSNHLIGCHKCPQLQMLGEVQAIPDRTHSIQKMKKWVSEKFDVHYIFPSQWMQTEAQKVLNFRVKPTVINNGIDIDLMPNTSKISAKTRLGLPLDRAAIAISADNLANPRKGIAYAVKAIQSVRQLNPIVITIGAINDDLRKELADFEIHEMGYVRDFNALMQIYAAVDILLFCSLADNFPMTALEAMANQVTIVGFATGGMPEIVENNHTGFLVAPRDQNGLNDALKQIIVESKFQEYSQAAQQTIKQRFSRNNFLDQHLELYQCIAG